MELRKWIVTNGFIVILAVLSGCATAVRDQEYTPTVRDASVSSTTQPSAAIQEPVPATPAEIGLPATIGPKSPISFFAEIGRSNYEKPPCSLWNHECGGYETDWDMKPTMFRFGVEYSGFRFSYFDLGKYSINANACDDEAFVLQGGGRNCPTDTDWYFSSGSMRGFALTYRYRFLDHLFIEGGPAKFRQYFKIEKDDGFSFQEKLWGRGYLIGLGIETKNWGIGYYIYNTDIGGRFGSCSTPSGTGGVSVFTIEFKF